MDGMPLATIIEQAITRETEAERFYTDLATRVADPRAREDLNFLAGEEGKHRQFLEDYRAGRRSLTTFSVDQVVDYRIAEYLEEPALDSNPQPGEVYLVAAHRELNAYRFYHSLAALQPPGDAKEMLLLMAQQELRHKEKVEYLYSISAFPQTDGG